MSYQLHDLLGNLGVALILFSYLLVQIGRASATGIRYLVANGTGALLVLYSLWFDFNLSAFIIEIAWLVISLVGLGRVLHKRRTTRVSDDRIP
jgi:hypothetical protein